MNRALARKAIPTAFVVAALALGGCGSGSSGVTPKAYVKSICSSLRNWSTGIRSAGSQLQASAPGTTSLAKGKQNYRTFVSALVAATGRAADDLRSAGVPAVKNGKQISNALVGAFTQAKSGLAQASSAADALPTTSVVAYQAASSGVVTSIKQTLAQIATVRPEKDPQLHAAAGREPTCQALKTGSV